MATMSVEELYERYIKPLPLAERLRLISITTHDIAQQTEGEAGTAKRSIMELHGLGAEIWKGIDAQEYVNELRNEWDQQP